MTVKATELPPPAAGLAIGVLCGLGATLLWAGKSVV